MDQSTFWRKLFDFRFDNFVTKDVLGVVYALGLIVIAITYVGSVIGAFGAGSNCTTGISGQVCSGGDPAGGIIVLIFGLVIAFLAAIYLRIILEVVAVLFAIHYDIRALGGQVVLQRAPSVPSSFGGPDSSPPSPPSPGSGAPT
jgi:hypothetical protein